MDDTYQTYINRVAPMILSATHEHQVKNIQKSAKFAGGKPVSFPGYSIITPPWSDDNDNEQFYTSLHSCQQHLEAQLPPELMIPVTAASFHLTLADLIWADGYQDTATANADFDSQLKSAIADSFQQFSKFTDTKNSLELQLLGLTLFPQSYCSLPSP